MATFKFPIKLYSEIVESPGCEDMILAINRNKKKHLLITGCAGSGKTTVALLRAAKLFKDTKNDSIMFFTYNKLLREYLKNSSNEFPERNINGLYSWLNQNLNVKESWTLNERELKRRISYFVKQYGKFDSIIIDEGQDFPPFLYSVLLDLANHITICADDSQIIYPNQSTPESEIIKTFEPANVVLTRNYRNTKEIFNFAKYFIPEDERAKQEDSEPLNEDPDSKPVVYKLNSLEEQNQKLIDLINENKDSGNIGIAVDKNWKVKSLNKLLQNENIESCYHIGDDPIKEFKSPLIANYKSFKGLEFDIVILPDFHESNYRESLNDSGYSFTNKDFYVACTRAKEKLFILAHEELPEIIKTIPKELYKIK